jgi:hypothetical protein
MGVIGIGVSACVASADAVLTFDLNQLSASFESRTQALIVQSVNADPLASVGVFERVLSPGGVATFSPPGEVSNDQWSFVFFTSVVLDGPETASGVGFFTAMDRDGDAFRADVRTTFRFSRPGVIEMIATVRNFQFTSYENGIFEGSDGSGWSTNVGPTGHMDGELHAELFGGSTFFTGPFAGRDVHLSGSVVPSSSAAVVMLAGAWAMVRRRRTG